MGLPRSSKYDRLEEKMIMAYQEFLHSLVIDANNTDMKVVPARLIADVSRHTIPVQALTNIEGMRAASEAFYYDFSFIARSATSEKPPASNEVDIWKGLLRFLIEGLKNWTAKDDSHCHELVSLLLIAYFVMPNGEFWEFCPIEINKNDDLKDKVAMLIGVFSTDLGNAEAKDAPLWEKEMLKEFVQADATEDWQALSDLIPRFRSAIRPSILFISLVRCLQRLAPSLLATKSGSVNEIPVALFISSALPPGASLELALNSTSSRIQFVCVFELVSDSSITLTSLGQELLTQILTKVSQNFMQWNEWMRAFNKFPSRYPEFQIPLGHTLSGVEPDRIQSYIESHRMSPSLDIARITVSNCLRAFAKKSSLPQRLLMWQCAFQRWNAWNFITQDNNNGLTDIARSVFDYAVVGFIVEAMSESTAESESDEIATTFHNAIQDWQPSLVHFNSVLYQQLSRYQPYAHAKVCRSKSCDFSTSVKYSIVNSVQQPYLAAMLLAVDP